MFAFLRRFFGRGPAAARPQDPGLDSPRWEWVKASSFADAADVASYRRCMAAGRSNCLSVGDNGEGYFRGADTTDLSRLYVALPPEEWKARFGTKKAASHARVWVRYGNRVLLAELADTMPPVARCLAQNGALLDMAPGLAARFGLAPPFLVNVAWCWA